MSYTIQLYAPLSNRISELDNRPFPLYQGKFSTHTAFFFHNAHLWNELRNVMLVTVLLIVYLVFMAPYVVRVKVDQIMQVCLSVLWIC